MPSGTSSTGPPDGSWERVPYKIEVLRNQIALAQCISSKIVISVKYS